ncbi:ArsR family transcriptional regulator [Corynebacterium humireducens NBRC 106098 = DSM 45392]|uniref:ArsR family transcriptional regulator n=1 Tax=Corynebacterium humireducens NBRC 106098 = DSM 45392 TaxID=1223515 RepID=A0A0B5DAD6_9CORY|nr:ArsR family transcriptional regulator [Corynebacterium humireducens NBRC 106098 = DSM 45392]
MATVSAQPQNTTPETRTVEGDTRRQIMLMLLKLAPVTASDLADRLDMSAAGVRRHLDILVAEGLAETLDRRVRSTGTAAAPRGRPAKAFRLTDQGRSQFGHSYDQLAAEALELLRETGGEEAVRRLAAQRIARIVEGVTPAGEDEDSIQQTAGELADAFDRAGYAATVTRAGSGIQICHHHCPVAHVAAEHPELCEVEHQLISDLVGVHVQPLASISGGHGICTTNIPLTPIEKLPEERSGS